MFEHEKWYDKLPSDAFEVCNYNLDLFFRTMYERQLIWKRRFLDGKPRPWTENAMLANYKFTNVYRELDRSSQWQIRNILLDKSLSLTNLVWKLMVYRFFNSPETFTFEPSAQGDLFNQQPKEVGASRWRNGIPDYEQYDEDEFADFIQSIRDAGGNPYTNAYLINSMATPGKPRDYCYTRLVIPSLHKAIPRLMKEVLSAKKPEDIIKFLKTIPAVADFIAHEFYQDFTYIPRYTDRHFMRFDQNDYTNVGPGASVGIRLIFPQLKGKAQKQGIYRLRDMAADRLEQLGKTLGEPFPYLYFDKSSGSYYTNSQCNITLHQIEMWLCEFQKYWKMTIGEGKQRSEFVPKTKTWTR